MNARLIALGGFLVWLSSQGCMFTHDTACVSNADCRSGRVCQAGECVGGSEAIDKGGSSGEGPVVKPSTPKTDDPAKSLACFGDATKPWVSPEKWPAPCIADELPATVQGVPSLTSSGESDKAFRFDQGVLTEYDGRSCIPCMGYAPNGADTVGTSICYQTYHCGDDCSIALESESLFLPEGVSSPGWVAGVTCPEYVKYYLGNSSAKPVCNPQCSGKSCGDDGCGGTCGSCAAGLTCSGGSCSKPRDYCSECLSSCSGLPSCCTGSGCICDSAC